MKHYERLGRMHSLSSSNILNQIFLADDNTSMDGMAIV
jgi:hypothetical protein